jgi:competence protein ComEA
MKLHHLKEDRHMLKRTPLIFIVAIMLMIFNLCCISGCDKGQMISITLKTTPAEETAECIYIGGNVNNPGFYPLKSADSIKSLIQAAGGIQNRSGDYQLELILDNGHDSTQKIDINRAEAWLLEALPGIGETRAQSIIQYRIDNGGFKNINELLKVDGIGQDTFDNLKDLITAAD